MDVKNRHSKNCGYRKERRLHFCYEYFFFVNYRMVQVFLIRLSECAIQPGPVMKLVEVIRMRTQQTK